MKRPKIFLTQIPIWLLLSFAVISPCLISLRNDLAEDMVISPLNALLIIFPTLIGMKLIALLLINKIVFSIPKFRKETEIWVKNTAGQLGYFEAQRKLKKISLVVIPVCIILIYAGMNI